MAVQSIMKRKQDCKFIPSQSAVFILWHWKKNLKEVVKISIDSWAHYLLCYLFIKLQICKFLWILLCKLAILNTDSLFYERTILYFIAILTLQPSKRSGSKVYEQEVNLTLKLIQYCICSKENNILGLIIRNSTVSL